MKKTFACTIMILISLQTNQCINETGSNIFGDDHKTIKLTSPADGGTASSGTSFKFEVPEDMAYAVLGIFDSPVVVTNGTTINTTHWTYGNRTGLSGYSPGSVLTNAVYQVNADKTDFISNAGFNPPGTSTRYWAVWGYDEYGNLAFASESRTVNYP